MPNSDYLPFFNIFLELFFFFDKFRSFWSNSSEIFFLKNLKGKDVYTVLKGIDRGYFIFSASAKTNCWILELCIWLVSKLIGLPLLKRTPHQSKAEACYRQITYFQNLTSKAALCTWSLLQRLHRSSCMCWLKDSVYIFSFQIRQIFFSLESL